MENAQSQPTPSYSLWEITTYFLRLGTLGFGGPVALVGYMYRDLVETREWIAESDYKEGLSLAQLAPGPLAAQTAIYLGYVHYGILGATLTGMAFVVPSFFMVVALGWAYVRYGGLAWMQAVFYGVGASVIGIIAFSAHKLTKKTLGKDKLLWMIYLAALVVTAVTESEKVALFFAAGILTWLVKAPPRFLRRRSAALSLVLPLGLTMGGDTGLLGRIFLFFAKGGAFVFGSGLALCRSFTAGW
jgi:chromate transporter